MKKYSEIGLERRRSERLGLVGFFEKHVKNIKSNRSTCLNCGSTLLGDISEVAHRLPKTLYKSIMLDDDNVVYLCSYKSPNNCHALYDGSNEQLQSLKIFNSESKIIKVLLGRLKEKYNWKLLDRWKLE